jgi:single-strand DNA-binding protein
MNNVVLIGRLTKDPDVRYTQDQMAIANFTLAVDRQVQAGKEKQADFIRITVFGKQAESCEKYLAKGRMVGIQGSLRTGSYQSKDGATVYTTEVAAYRVEFLDWGDKTGKSGGGAQARSDDFVPYPEGGYVTLEGEEDDDVPF